LLDAENALKNSIQHFCVFGGQPEQRLKMMHKTMAPYFSFEKFKKLYDDVCATDPHAFLYMSKQGDVRRCFDAERIKVE
jgi:hypothetical protein